MNNKTAAMIRDYAMGRVFEGVETSEMIQIDSGKFVIPMDIEGTVYYAEVDFVAKKEDYTPDYDIKKYAEKLKNAEEREKEKAQKRAKKSKEPKTE